eukprot:CAMPEP_0198149662 /NCGR_PEP_ID=MMETSP1443-20131203/47695_1 /TAXON_ID=186043 /ORGANISM="Entomoneis sp., Strain CCMP2396" /LENGTH=71 /DNA_ID=CAMNT_0043814767 /DNA_START=13 /DNA_END=224 /DNA_ORIENTATION=-
MTSGTEDQIAGGSTPTETPVATTGEQTVSITTVPVIAPEGDNPDTNNNLRPVPLGDRTRTLPIYTPEDIIP